LSEGVFVTKLYSHA